MRESIGPRYSGRLHFAFTNLLALSVIAFALSRLRSPSALAWLTVPITFFYANLVEYLAHRNPMHRPLRPFGLIYRRHSLEHHAFFTDQELRAESTRDFKLVLFPWFMVLFFFGLFALPMGLVVRAVLGPNVGAIFLATAMAYFLTYEWLHLAYHLGPETALGGVPFIQSLRRHHQTHHDPRQMSRANFNITFPICDAIFGTSASGNRLGVAQPSTRDR